ncbi:hypothetical protein LguiB_006624 [Lonicera macranthoides]
MYEHMERKQLLNTPAEQSRLLQEVPMVIPQIEELKPFSEDVKDDDKSGGDEGSPISILSEIPDEKKHHGQVSIPEEKHHLTETSLKELPQQTPNVSPKVQLNALEIERPRSPKDQSNDTLQSEQNQQSSHFSTKQTAPVDFAGAKCEDPPTVQLIELSSDDEEDNNDGGDAAIGIQELEDTESSVWHFLGTDGEPKGPYSLSFLKRWSDYTSFALKFKVWKTSQSEENGICLGDAVNRGFLGK